MWANIFIWYLVIGILLVMFHQDIIEATAENLKDISNTKLKNMSLDKIKRIVSLISILAYPVIIFGVIKKMIGGDY